MSNHRVALDKDGTGFAPGHVVDNIRPISIADAVRYIAAKCQTLHEVEAKLREAGQYGAGTKNGTDLVYHKLSESMDSFVEAVVASRTPLGDAVTLFAA